MYSVEYVVGDLSRGYWHPTLPDSTVIGKHETYTMRFATH